MLHTPLCICFTNWMRLSMVALLCRMNLHPQGPGCRPGLGANAGGPHRRQVQALCHGGKAPDGRGAGEHHQGLRVLLELRTQIQGPGRLVHCVVKGQLPYHRTRDLFQLFQQLPAPLLRPRQPDPVPGRRREAKAPPKCCPSKTWGISSASRPYFRSSASVPGPMAAMRARCRVRMSRPEAGASPETAPRPGRW